MRRDGDPDDLALGPGVGGLLGTSSLIAGPPIICIIIRLRFLDASSSASRIVVPV